MTKIWYRSKTVWVNLIAVAAMIVQSQTGFIIAPEAQATFIVVINLVLRAVTGEELELTRED